MELHCQHGSIEIASRVLRLKTELGYRFWTSQAPDCV